MNKDWIMVLTLLFVAGCGSPKSQEAAALPNPPPPFASKQTTQGVPEIGAFDGMVNIGGCGSQAQKQFGVVCGANKLLVAPGAAALRLTLDSQPRPTCAISLWGSTARGWGHPFDGAEPTASFDSATKTITVVKTFHAASAKELDGTFTETIRLLDDGLVEVKYAATIPADGKLTDLGLFFNFQNDGDGMDFTVDGKGFAFSSGKNRLFGGKAASLRFSPERPGRNFSLNFPSPRSLEAKADGSIRVAPDADGAIAFTLDMRDSSAEALKTADTFANVNFWKDDRLHIPAYGKCRNLAQNPSFEAGLRYYRLGLWTDYTKRDQPVMAVDDNVAKFGDRSLRISAFKPAPLHRPDQFQTFALPTVPGQKYTVSFHAKGDRKSGLRLEQVCVSGVWLQFPPVPGFGVDDQWRRYSYTVTAPNNVLTFLMSAIDHGSAPGDAHVWIDGLQIEAGDKATDYTEKPLSAQLLTSDPDNFLKVGEPVEARLRIRATANTAGSVSCVLEDYFYKKVWERQADFKTDNKGVAWVDLPLDAAFGTGIYVLRADFMLNGFEDTDFFRVARMEPLANTHLNKDIFATNLDCHHWRGDDLLERYRDIGIGSTNYLPGSFGMPPAKVQEFMARLFRAGVAFTDGELLEKMKDFGVKENLREVEAVTPDLERRVEEAAFQIAKTYPECRIWGFKSEFEGCKLVQNKNFKDFAKIQVACGKGVRRADPNKKFYLAGSCNMEPRSGTDYVDKYLQATAELDSSFRYDGFTIHPYRTTPENPDLDDDTAVFLAMLAKNGYPNAPVLWEEGIYYTYYQIPEWGLDPHRGCSTDHYRAGCPSYHMGWGERISAAYFARSWLVALKYRDHVKQFNGWCSWINMDMNLTPLALQKIPNTLGLLLGDAKFKRDIRFAPESRCYLFEDGQGRPVAALWSHRGDVDRGFEPAPSASFDFKGQNLEFFDLMGNVHPVPVDEAGLSELPITPFPCFVRGESGTLERLAASVERARPLGDGKPTLRLSARPLSVAELRLNVGNLITRPFKGAITTGSQEKALELGPKAAATLNIPMPESIPADHVAAVKVPVSVTEDGAKPVKTDIAFDAFAIGRFKGTWTGVPVIQIKNRTVMKSAGSTTNVQLNEPVGDPGDFEASFQMAWDDAALHLRVAVVDDVFIHNSSKNVGGRWDNDSLQLYIDTLCDARDKDTRGFDGNDYNYDFYPNPDGAVTAFRRYAPEQQAAGGLFAPMPNMVEPEIKGTFTRTADGYVYEITIPKRLVVPFELKAGNSCGLALYLNDKDKEHVKSALTLTPPGTGGYQSPHLYPVTLLVE